jgi:hypothetical protein
MRIVSAQEAQVDLYNAITGTGASARGAQVEFRRGTLVFTDTVHIDGCAGMKALGNSLGGSKWVWAGPADRPFISMTSSARNELAYIHFAFDTPCQSLIKITDQGSGSASNYRSTMHWIHDLEVEDSDGALTDVIWVARTPDGAKNDHHTFERIMAQDYGGVFGRVEGQASVNVKFIACEAMGRDHGQYGIYNGHDDYTLVGGQVSVIGGIWMEHQVADFYTTHRYGKFVIDTVFSEQSARLLVVPEAPASNSAVMTGVVDIRGLRYTTNSTVQPADHEFIQCAGGLLSIAGGSAGLNASDLEYLIKYNVADVDKAMAWSIRDFTFLGSAPATSHWQTGDAPASKINVWRYVGSTNILTAL